MKAADYWNLFYESGRIDDYLQYACTSEESQLIKSVQGDTNNVGKCDGDGVVSIAH